MSVDERREQVAERHRKLAKELCREHGLDGAIRCCRKNAWHDVLEAIEAEKDAALSLPMPTFGFGEELGALR